MASILKILNHSPEEKKYSISNGPFLQMVAVGPGQYSGLISIPTNDDLTIQVEGEIQQLIPCDDRDFFVTELLSNGGISQLFIYKE